MSSALFKNKSSLDPLPPPSLFQAKLSQFFFVPSNLAISQNTVEFLRFFIPQSCLPLLCFVLVVLSATVTDLSLVVIVPFGRFRNGSAVNGALYYVIVGVCAPTFRSDASVAAQMLTLDRSKRFHPSLHVPPYTWGFVEHLIY